MAFVQLNAASVAFGDRDILKEVTLHLSSGTRAALAGANGSGKSTLLKVLAGILPPDSGDRALQRSCRVSYLPQSGGLSPTAEGGPGRTVREEAEKVYAPVLDLLEKIEELGRRLEGVVRDDGKTGALLEEHRKLQEAVECSGYYEREQRISSVLGGLGFSPDDLDRPISECSGGWQMRLALGKVLLEEGDILLLDEPTNYLDIEARTWLEGWLREFSGGCLLVSHDRYFLDVTVTEVYELFQGALKRYGGNYRAYEETRRKELEEIAVRYRLQQEEIAKTEALIRRFRYKPSKAAFAQDLIKRLARMERIELPESFKKIRVSFPPPPPGGRVALSTQGLGKRYGSLQVLRGLNLTLETGEKLVVVGPNGAGKTTLLRILAGVDGDFEGRLHYGPSVSRGSFSQDAAEALGSSETVLELLEGEAPPALAPKVRDLLGSFLFRGEDVFKPVSVLSGGEKSRLALLRLLLNPLNLLILDEPTNHLDLSSKDILLSALQRFPGTIIFVSHDRAFMEALSTKTLELTPPPKGALPRSPRLFYGNYGYYLDRLEREGTAPSGEKPPGKAPPARTQRDAAKQRQAQLRRRERQEAELLRQIEALEGEKTQLEAEIARPEVYSNGAKARQIQGRIEALAAGIEEKAREWEELLR